MTATLEELKDQALRLPPAERGVLAAALIASLDNKREDSPETIAAAWEDEISRRVDDMEKGSVRWIPAEQVFASLDQIVRGDR